mgnify:FL=1|jgi:hypothetical protein|tara:strand:- start:107 stop:259 length:153 start_codon:yes stop_codon:yes gene_type:complete
MASNVYLVMNELGCESVYGSRDKADKRCAYLSEKYAMVHWIEKKEITTDG